MYVHTLRNQCVNLLIKKVYSIPMLKNDLSLCVKQLNCQKMGICALISKYTFLCVAQKANEMRGKCYQLTQKYTVKCVNYTCVLIYLFKKCMK